ncbi:MAG: NAD(+) synthase, partial [Bowdeniella nasicola]|nr:NAD(+) synthase [Bowdeniella nasicola]
ADQAKLGILLLAIAPMVDTFMTQLPVDGVAAENVQARIRGQILMAISNQEGPLVLATGNRTEVAVGYSTMYGDSVGGYAPIGDVPKTLVWELSRWRNQVGTTPAIPEGSITKPPSAELRPDQQDSDSLPPYDELDAIIEALIDRRENMQQIIARGFEPGTVARVVGLVERAEWKRHQFAHCTKISPVTFGVEYLMPSVHHFQPRSS